MYHINLAKGGTTNSPLAEIRNSKSEFRYSVLQFLLEGPCLNIITGIYTRTFFIINTSMMNKVPATHIFIFMQHKKSKGIRKEIF